jgi:uncharacterized membrane protein
MLPRGPFTLATKGFYPQMRRHAADRRWPWKPARLRHRRANSSLNTVVERNLEAIDEHRNAVEKQKTIQDHTADWITYWTGSMLFVYIHMVWFAAWVAVNLGFFGIRPFDPYPFGMLTTIVSLEAIFLSTFVLVSQNRQAELADRRSELDLQVNLLAEYEMTRVLTLIDAIAKRLDISECDDAELVELKEDVEPREVLRELDRRAEPEQKK